MLSNLQKFCQQRKIEVVDRKIFGANMGSCQCGNVSGEAVLTPEGVVYYYANQSWKAYRSTRSATDCFYYPYCGAPLWPGKVKEIRRISKLR